MARKYKYKVWTDSESQVDIPEKKFTDIDKAADYAIDAVHEYDDTPFKAIVHIEDLDKEETIETYEND